MTVRSWFTILVFEVLVALFVMLLFTQLDKQIAGLLGGFLFGLLGLSIGFLLLKNKTLKSFTFWWLFVYMFYSVLPMMIRRLENFGADFSNIQVWGMTGPEFHKVSERIYLVLIICTILDLLLTYRATRATK